MDEQHGSCQTETDLKPKCNKTITCELGHGCYALWKNISGTITFKKKGCWPNKICTARKDNLAECVGHYNSHNDLYFCCCLGFMCNKNISNVTTIRQDTKSGKTYLSFHFQLQNGTIEGSPKDGGCFCPFLGGMLE